MNSYRQGNQNRDLTMKDKWSEYLKGGYFEKVGGETCLRTELVSFEKMDDLAATMADQRLSKTQLRRFFSHCRAIEVKLKGGESWEKVRPLFLKMRYVAAHSRGQTSREFPLIFFDFISRNVDQVKTKDDFLLGFMPHFEALVGFSSKYQR
jgi:CRISPR type III-A-associated protein Csm2